MKVVCKVSFGKAVFVLLLALSAMPFVTSAMALFAGLLFAVVFGGEFAAAGALLRCFAPLLFVVGVSNVLGSLYLTPAGFRRRSNYAIVTGAGVNLLLNILLIPRFGGMGAVVASLAAESVISVLYVWFSHPFVAAGCLLRIAARYAAYGVAVFLPTYALARRMSPSWSALLAQAAVGLAVYAMLLLVCRDPLWQVWRRLRKEGDSV